MVNRDSDGINFVERAALYGLLGVLSGRKDADLARLAIGIPIVEKLTGVKLEDALAAEAQRQQEMEQLEQIRQAIQTALKRPTTEPVESSPNTGLLVPGRVATAVEPDARWRQVVIHPSVTLILGKRGSGKSALGYRILELPRYGPRPYGEAFATVKGDKRCWSFVYAPDADFKGLLENSLPFFWKPSLSRLFAAGHSPSTPRAPKWMTPQEKAQKAREMRAGGASYGEIGRALGVKSRSTVQNYIKGYPYQR